MKTSQAIAISIFFIVFFGALWFFYSHGKQLSYVETIDNFDDSRYKLEPLVRSQIVTNECKWPIGEKEELSRINKIPPCSRKYEEIAQLRDSKLYINPVDSGLRCTMADLFPSNGEEEFSYGTETEISIFFIVFFGALWFFYSHGKQLSYVETIDNFDDSRYKLEPLVRSQIVTNECKWPIGEKEELSRINKIPPCSRKYEEIAQLRDSKLYINPVDSGLRCTMADLFPSNGEEEFSYGTETEAQIDEEFTVSSSMFVVKCSIGDKEVYEKAFVNIIPQQNSTVSILLFENLRHSDFHILFPRTWKLMEKLRFITSHMYHKTGSSSQLDKVLEEANEKGCKMNVSGDGKKSDLAANLAVFKQFLIKKMDKTACLEGGNSIWEELVSVWSDSLFSGVCLTTVSIDPYGVNARRMDNKMSEILFNLEAKGAFINNSVIFITHQMEDNSSNLLDYNPFFSIRLSDKMKKNNARAHLNLRQNAYSLTTSEDVYGTIRDVISNNLTTQVENEDSSMDRTLFIDFSYFNNTCEDRGISDEECLCMKENEELSHRIDNGTIFLDNLYGFIENEVLRIPCVHNISIDWQNNEYQRVYETTQLERTGEPRRMVEFGIKYMNRKTNRSRIVTGLGSLHIHLLSDSTFRLLRPPVRLSSNYRCYANTLEDICVLCHEEPHLII